MDKLKTATFILVNTLIVNGVAYLEYLEGGIKKYGRIHFNKLKAPRHGDDKVERDNRVSVLIGCEVFTFKEEHFDRDSFTLTPEGMEYALGYFKYLYPKIKEAPSVKTVLNSAKPILKMVKHLSKELPKEDTSYLEFIFLLEKYGFVKEFVLDSADLDGYEITKLVRPYYGETVSIYLTNLPVGKSFGTCDSLYTGVRSSKDKGVPKAKWEDLVPFFTIRDLLKEINEKGTSLLN